MVSDIPYEWIRVTVEKQYLNPQWAAIQMVKKGLIESTLLQLPEEHREMQRMGIEIQVEAQFHGYEEQFEQFITVSEEVYVSPPSKNNEIKSSWEQVVDILGLEEDFVSSLSEAVDNATPQVETQEANASEATS
jgi:hypothetical protein